MSFLSKGILRTLAYADIFDYPLTSEELYFFLITGKVCSYSVFEKVLKQIEADGKQMGANRGYFFLKGREEIVAIRKKRERWSEEKLRMARRVAEWFRLVPWVRMVGVTGALAMKNSDREDDIDFLIIAAKDRLWLTRFLVVLLVELLGKRRRPRDKEVRDKVCLNMFLDEKHLGLSKREQDLFTAHEVCHLKLLWDRDGIYEKFLWENRWMKKYLPNAAREIKKLSLPTSLPAVGQGGQGNGEIKQGKFPQLLITQLLNYLEVLAYRVQLAYMRPRKTIEVTEPGRIFFHPQDCREWVLKEYQKGLERLALPFLRGLV